MSKWSIDPMLTERNYKTINQRKIVGSIKDFMGG